MKTATFSCPHCSSPLRIRDRAFVEREVDCPDCGARIEVTLDRDKEPVAQKVETPPTEIPRKKPPRVGSKKTKTKKQRAKSNNGSTQEDPKNASPRINRNPLFRLGEKFSGVPEVLLSPVGIAWSVAGLVGLTMLIMAWPSGEDSNPQTKPAEEQQAATVPTPGNPLAENPSSKKETPLPEIPDPPVVIPANPNTLRPRFDQLGKSIKTFVDVRGRFPIGTVAGGDRPAKDRFSWIAEMAIQTDNQLGPEPQWDQAWSDPLNDRFVRQPLQPFLNPLLDRQVGEEGYPATHFAGIAGVGPSGPNLPVDHPQAGIFGYNRITRIEDIKDGLGNTMMVAGVRTHLGSWAAGGRASIRPFTQEPYIDGPDGFGTGETDGMSVVMADGSVRFLSKNTSPTVIRRMAAMADGFSLDEAIPGEPGDDPPTKPLTTKPEHPPLIAQNPPNPKPVPQQNPPQPDPVKPEPPEPKIPEPEPAKPVDIPAALAVKIVKFEQLQNVPFQELLDQVEEMCGVPIRPAKELPEATAGFWTQPVSLNLKQTTVQQILETLLEKQNLTYTIQKDHIQLQNAK